MILLLPPALSLIDGHPAILDDAGIERLVYEDYYELLKEIVEKAGKGMTEAELLETFQTPESAYPHMHLA